MDAVTMILFVIGLVLLIAGAEVMVRGASRLALALGVSPVVVGLTIVAFGTSTPEMAVSAQSALAGQPDLALGNAVGSNIANVLLILGISAAVTPLVVAQQIVRFDIPLMIFVSVITFGLSLNGVLSRLEGVLLFAGIIAYTVFAIVQSRKENKAIQEEYAQEFDKDHPKKTPREIATNIVLFVVGLVMIMLGARWLVDGATAIARALGMSELIIGLTVVAVGTSLPELATSVIASLRGERDIAVGNVVGSNIFNLLAVLGIAGIVSPNGVTVSEASLSFDLPVMIAVAVACLPIFTVGNVIARWQGLLFVGYYIAYTAYLVLAATQHDALSTYSTVMLSFVLPLTAITLGVIGWRARRLGRLADTQQSGG